MAGSVPFTSRSAGAVCEIELELLDELVDVPLPPVPPPVPDEEVDRFEVEAERLASLLLFDFELQPEIAAVRIVIPTMSLLFIFCSPPRLT